ncbi:MAG TPA: DUF6289 family protein [Thermoanaerobaculia bacterium]|nr:DUF6289 family protein [Thermoanaerobaculia bacterium]
MLQSLRSHRRPLFALALVGAFALVLLLGLPSASRAVMTKTGHDFTYYDDAAHDNVVGYRYYCIGNSGGWGRITAYSEINSFPCN